MTSQDKEAAPLLLSWEEAAELRQEWWQEIFARRSRMQAWASWLSGAAVVTAGWLWNAELKESVPLTWAVAVLGLVFGLCGMYAVWYHARIRNRVARVIDRLNEGAGLKRSLVGIELPWGGALGGWDVWLYSILLSASFLSPVVVQWLKTTATQDANITWPWPLLVSGLGWLIGFLVIRARGCRRSILEIAWEKKHLSGVRVTRETTSQ